MIIGFEKDLGSDTLFRVEGYYKTFDDLIVGRLEPEAERFARVARYDFPADLQANVPSEAQITSTPLNGGRGTAYGVDAYLVRSNLTSRLAGWLSYAWGRADRDTYGLRFPFEYDRRHTFNAVGRERIGRGWSVAATAQVATGFPYTPAIGLRVASKRMPEGGSYRPGIWPAHRSTRLTSAASRRCSGNACPTTPASICASRTSRVARPATGPGTSR